MLWHKVRGQAEMRHTKQYAGNDVELRCNGKLIASSTYRGTNFSLNCPKCGMEVQTIGCSPETDKVLDYERKK